VLIWLLALNKNEKRKMNTNNRYYLAKIYLRVPWEDWGGLVPHKYSKGKYNTHIIMKLFAALTFAAASGTAVFAAGTGAEAQQYNNNNNNKCNNLLRVSY
jgi:hypothetical protein